jgi:selenocysteine lyase/cysteine desulfurase
VPIDVDAMGIDLLAFPGHKGLLGPPGTGGLYVGPRTTVAAWREGGTGVLSELPLQPQTLPLRLEAGSPNTLGIALWGESLRFLLQYDVAWVRERELLLAARLLEGLQADARFTVYGPARLADRVAVVSLRLRGVNPQAMADALDARFDIAVRAGLHCAPGAHQGLGTYPEGTVRISPGYFTTEQHIDACLEALRALAEEPALAFAHQDAAR